MPHRLREPALWHTLRFRIGAGALLLVSAIFALVTLNTQRVLEQATLESSRANARQIAQTLNLAMAPHTATPEALANIRPYLQELISPESEGLIYLVLLDEQGRELARTDAVPEPLPPVDADLNAGHAWQRGVLHLQQGILLGDQHVGRLRYGLSSSLLREAAERLFKQNLLAYASVLAVLTLLLGWLLGRLGGRLRALTDAGVRPLARRLRQPRAHHWSRRADAARP